MAWLFGGYLNAHFVALLAVLTTSAAAPMTIHPDAKKFFCPSVSSDPTPARLDDLSLDKGSGVIKYILLEPRTTSRTLCTLTRVNDAFKAEVSYIPIARAYDENPNWSKSAGRYSSTTEVTCGEADADGGSEYQLGDRLCQIKLDPPLELTHDGYYLTSFQVDDNLADERAIVASFLERVTFGPTAEEINQLHTQYSQQGPMALAMWLKQNLEKPITSHRAQFRKALHPRAVESYIYGIPGPRPCERDARFRRFAFTYTDVEISRGSSSPADHTGAPYTKMEIETIQIDGENHWAVKFGDHIRTILSSPMEYYSEASRSGPSGDVLTLPDGQYTLCNAEEVAGNQIGGTTFDYAFQILVGATCSSSYTNRGGEDSKGDGAIDLQQIKPPGSNQLARTYDSSQCNSKCISSTYVRYVKGGNPIVNIPSGFDMTTISYLDLTKLSNPSTQLVNLNPEKFHDSSWRMTVNLDASFVPDPPSCRDENGNEIPDAAGLSYNDYFSSGRGKYNLDPPIFAKMPGNKWALHDYRSKFQANTLENPLADAGGSEMKRARRRMLDGTPYGDGSPSVDLVTRCSNVEANIFNEEFCQISYDENACETVPAMRAQRNNPSTSLEDVGKYIPAYAGRGVVVCGSDNEVKPDQSDDDYYAVSNRKLNTHRISYGNQIRTVWMEQALYAEDQACQKLAWHLSKIFAYSNGHGEEEIYLNTYDWAFVASCASTYADIVNKMTHSVQMAEQLTFIKNKAVAYSWHRHNVLNYPDENYGRENLQLHQIGLQKLHEDGTAMLDRFGREIPNYTQKNIFSASKIFAGFERSSRRGNYNDLDRTTTSYLDPLVQKSIVMKDWFPKIGFDSKYIGDQYPLCADLPTRHFLQKGAKFVALGGNNLGRYHHDNNNYYLDDEVQKLQLNFEGGMNSAGSTFPASPLFDKICRRKQSYQYPTTTLAEGTGQAEYDSSIGAPKCDGSASKCDSGNLLEKRYPFEPNSSHNTIDNCEDGIPDPSATDPMELLPGETSAVITESVNRIVVAAVGGSVIRGGSWVSIQATVNPHHENDHVDYFYAADAANPVWKYITTVSPRTGLGNHEVTLPRPSREKITFRLPNCDMNHCDVAVRVSLRSTRVIRSNYWWHGSNQRDGAHRPNACPQDIYDDTDDLVFQVLPSPRPQDMCNFQATITLDQSLSYCNSNVRAEYTECHVDTLRVVEVLPGLYYEYVRPPCVNMPFLPDSASAKVTAGTNMKTAVCADKRLPSATSTCCGDYPDRQPKNIANRAGWADILADYRNERLTYDGNVERCNEWERQVCQNPSRIGPSSMWSGHCQHRMSCKESSDGGGRWLESIWYHWTSQPCEIKAKIDVEGMVAVVHAPEGQEPLPLVDFTKTESFFSVHWDESNMAAGKLAYPHTSDNLCAGGEIRGDFCFCSTSVQEESVFVSLPTRTQVLDELHIGAFDPTETGVYSLQEQSNDVKVYTKDGAYAMDTIFQVVNEYSGQFLYFKNMRSVVSVCNGAFQFRNAPSFYNMANPDLVSAKQEMEAYLQAVIDHDSAPPFTCKSLIQLFGSSNPSPEHVLRCSQAFKSGTFLFSDPEAAGATLSFGSGKRSDMHAILAAIVLSPESYSPSVLMDPASGGVQDPFEKVLHVMRSMELTRTLHHRRSDGLLQGNVAGIIGSSCYGPPDQFSFYSPAFIPPGTFLELGLTSPPGELATMNKIVGLSNALYSLLRLGFSSCNGGIGIRWDRSLYGSCGNGWDGFYTNTAAYLSYAPSDASSVVGELALLLTSNRLSPENRQIIEAQVSLSYGESGSLSEAVQVATILIMSTPEFHTWNSLSMSGAARTVTPSIAKNPDVSYKTIVHINLSGGMDSMNMLVPHPDGCQSLYDEYKDKRGTSNYVTSMIKIDATTSEQPCTHFGVNSALNHLATMYNEGDAIFFANIGHLQKAVNRYDFKAETNAQLFSHHSMKEEMFKVDAFRSRLGTGVLGRLSDVFSFSMAVGQTSVISSSTILKGDPSLANPVKIVKTGGLDPFYYGREICAQAATDGNSRCTAGSVHSNRSTLVEKMQELNAKTLSTSSIQAEFWSQSFIDAIAETDSFRSLLNDACKSQDGSDIVCSSSSACPNGCKCSSGKCKGGGATIPDNNLGRELDMVFQLIAANEARNVNRDFFAVELKGFDTHFEMVSGLNAKFAVINTAIHGFRQDLKNAVLGDGTTLWDKVTLVMSSEFGRSVSPNSSAGTDHGWGGNAVMMGGEVNGGIVLGHHPETYNPADDYNTGRGVWIPSTAWESLWYGVIQWAGITNENAINFILPNANNFGCNLYSEVDLFIGGTASIPGCGGSVLTLEQNFIVSEPRVMIPEEQKAFCDKVVAKIAQGNIRCFILKQTLSEIPRDSRILNENGNVMFKIVVDYEISSDLQSGVFEDLSITAISSAAFQAEAADIIEMEVVTFEQAEVVIVTSSPSESPSLQPSESPTVLDICSIVTSGIFNELFPTPSSVYTYSGFCSAVENWNQNNSYNPIFAADYESSVRHQLAAFIGHVLHESNALQLTRESSQCPSSTIFENNGIVYCNPVGHSGGDYTDPYCSMDGCACESVEESPSLGYNSNKLYFGRGPLQLSHGYNYLHAGVAANIDYCQQPDLVATDEVHGWASAFWFWTSFTDSNSMTCKDYVADESFAGTLKTINGEFECPSSQYGEGYLDAVILRLNVYCQAATAFNVEALLRMNDCVLLSNTLANCIDAGTCRSCDVWAGITFEPTSSPSTSMKPSGEPSFNPSLSTLPSGRPSLSVQPSVAIDIAPYYGHDLVGDGKCVGKVGGNHPFNTAHYNYLEFQNIDFVAAKLCPEACAVYWTHSKYRGFEFEAGKCRCLFDGEIDFSIDLEGRDSSPNVEVSNKLAQGTVTSFDATFDSVQCYAISVPEAPERVDNFEYVGYGECWDSSMATYEYVEISLSSESNPAVQCGAVCSPSIYPLSRGFVTKQGPLCNCLFDDGFDDASVTIISTEPTGTGPIVSSNFVEGHCYRALPAPTNFPTKAPTPKPTPRPTKDPTSSPSSIPSSVPSEPPSMLPSAEPSKSAYPSSDAGTSLSPSESSAPSTKSSPEPSLTPSKSSSPSSEPSLSPSESAQPSSGPSLNPSISGQPSSEPSGLPSTSSKPSSHPSIAPSESAQPSSGPSVNPSVSAQPSGQPSSDPSLSPSKSVQPSSESSATPSESSQPSSEPSLDPSTSAQPSSEPSASPSESYVPSSEQSSDPSAAPSKSIHPSRALPLVEMFFSTRVTISASQDALDQLQASAGFLTVLEKQVKDKACTSSFESLMKCAAKIKKVNGISVDNLQRNRLLRSRRILTTLSDLVIEFEVAMQLICTNSACSDAQTVGNQVYTKATGDLKLALQDGTFIAGVKDDLSASADINAILDTVDLSFGFEDLVIPILNLSRLWYPDWNSGEIRCKNDGNAPDYMTLGGGWWHESSKEECCTKYFLWAYDVCAGESAADISGYFPAWEESEPRCDTGDPPNYMRRNPKVWILDTPEECCQNYFAWAPTCVVNSGGTAAVDPTAALYYADWSQTNTCLNDGEAPGYMKSSPKVWMYNTLDECCKTNYFWGDQYSKCMAPGGTSAPASSPTPESWYVDWGEQICVTSCVGPKPCGGIKKSWNILHSSLSKCCKEHLWWKKACNRPF